MAFECLEDRALLSATPFGAAPDNTAEFMLGDVLVSVVLMESSENTSPENPNTENWNTPAIEAVKGKVIEGMTWWEQTLLAAYPNATHSLSFQYDFAYADNPVETDYEPIVNVSDDFQYWMYDFLDLVGYNSTGNFSSDIRAFNHAQRQTHSTDWAFTVFVVNDANDLVTDLEGPGMFDPDGSFDRAFAFPGGQFYVAPAGRPASTHSHETGHIFWARDEYQNGGSYTDRRGYYNAQNWNAWDNPVFQQPGEERADSIMARGTLLIDAYADQTSSDSSLQMIGWRDLDGDGVFDLLDVPLTLTGSGFVDPQAAEPAYRFVGSSSVQTTMNQNSSGLQNDITINEVSRAEYRIDGGNWQMAATFGANTYTTELDLYVPLPTWGFHTVDIRTIDDDSGVTSPVFQGDTTTAASVMEQGIYGFVWNDEDDNGEFDPGESGLPGWTVRMVDAEGEPLETDAVEPDGYGSKVDNVNSKVTLSAVGIGLDGSVYAAAGGLTSTGVKVFGYVDDYDGPGKSWTSESRRLRMDFHPAVAAVSLDAVGDSSGDYARLDVYSAGGQLLDRYTTDQLGVGEIETMTVSRSTPEIAYAIAHAHGHTEMEVRFDNLRFGPDTTTMTDNAGAYALTNLAAGTYFVEAVAPGSQDPLPQQQDVTLAEGEAIGDVNFDGQTPSWRNPGNPADVNDDKIVTPLDALVVINYINANLDDLSVPPPPAEPPPYYDVDGNGSVTALDVLIIIDVLNAQAAGEPGSGSGEGAGSSAEGEYTPTNLAIISNQSHKPEAQVRDERELTLGGASGLRRQTVAISPSMDEREPTIAVPLLATNNLNELQTRSESSPVSTPLDEAGPADRPHHWQAAADSYFQQISSAKDERTTAAGRDLVAEDDLDEILPEIVVEVTRLSDAFTALRA